MATATASVDWAGGGLGSDNGPILYSEPNRTSAIDDIRSVVIYIFIITIFLSFFLILPGIRNDKFPTFLCITSSLIVTSIILISLFGTTWHVGEAPISAAYKAFSRDRIQGDLSVKIGLQSVNITLRAHKYYILHSTHGPIIMDNTPLSSPAASQSTLLSTPAPSLAASLGLSALPEVGDASRFIDTSSQEQPAGGQRSNNLADELLRGRTADGVPIDTELEADEVFGPNDESANKRRRARSSNSNDNNNQTVDSNKLGKNKTSVQPKQQVSTSSNQKHQKYTIKRLNVDINYNERFYWIGPSQMRQEHHNALERGLPFPILTVVEYLSQDEAGFSWSRQYRLAGYYSYIILWLSLCVCILMFFLHCAAPKYGIYTMQILGCLLLFTNFTYATLVPRGDQKLIIPFEGQPLTFDFGWSFWLILIGGCLSLFVGTLIVVIDCLFPNFIFTTILDVDFDSHSNYIKGPRAFKQPQRGQNLALTRPVKPPFLNPSERSKIASSPDDWTPSSSSISTTSKSPSPPHQANDDKVARVSVRHRHQASQQGELSADRLTSQELEQTDPVEGTNTTAQRVPQLRPTADKGDTFKVERLDDQTDRQKVAQQSDVFSKTTTTMTVMSQKKLMSTARKSTDLKSTDQQASTNGTQVSHATTKGISNSGQYEEGERQVHRL